MEKKNDSAQVVAAVVIAIIIAACIVALIALKLESKIPALAQTHAESGEEADVPDPSSASSYYDSVSASIRGFETAENAGASDTETVEEEEGKDEEGEDEGNEYLCSFSAERQMTEEDVADLRAGTYDNLPEGKDIVQMVLNEMYARYGYQFKNQEIQEYFEKRQWYNEIPEKTSDMNAIYQNMTRIEKANVDFLSDIREG